MGSCVGLAAVVDTEHGAQGATDEPHRRTVRVDRPAPRAHDIMSCFKRVIYTSLSSFFVGMLSMMLVYDWSGWGDIVIILALLMHAFLVPVYIINAWDVSRRK